MKYLILSIFIFFSVGIKAQIELNESFQELLDRTGLEFVYPTENTYKKLKLPKEDFQTYDFGMYSRQEKLEIKYIVLPEPKNRAFYPNIKVGQKVTHLASNDEDDATVSILSVSENELTEKFNADWGKIFFFKPKKSVSIKEHCKLLALYKEGYGMAYVLFFFNDADQNLDNRFYTLNFKEEK